MSLSNSTTVFLFLASFFVGVRGDGDVLGKRIEALNSLALNQSQIIQRIQHEIFVVREPNLKLTQKHVDKLTEMFGTTEKGLKFARGFSRYVREVKKGLLPESLNFMAILKKILYYYVKAIMSMWKMLPESVKKQIWSFITDSPFLRGLLMKVMSYLPELMFDSLGGAMGLGSTLSGWAG